MKRGTSQRALTVVLMNVTIYPALVAMTILGILIFAPSLMVVRMATGLETSRIVRLFIWIYGRGWLAIVAPFIRLKCEGFKENLRGCPSILILNHLSFFDTYFMGALPFNDVTFAIRSWPFKMFWYRPFMDLAEYLDVERTGWERTSEKCKQIFAAGGCVLFFPEAHRSRDGRLGRFHSGAFRLAVETGIGLVPLCITGTDRLLPPRRWLLQPTRVRLRALEPVEPQAFSGEFAHIEMRIFVKRMMASSIAQINAGNRE
jgi:1-acyl-sn-glycerol-3-phosphate acyltransferase